MRKYYPFHGELLPVDTGNNYPAKKNVLRRISKKKVLEEAPPAPRSQNG